MTSEPVLVDTSAWVEFLRDTGSRAARRVDEMLAGELVTCDVVVMEVLAGARSEVHLSQLRGLLARCRRVATTAEDYETAALLLRTCRRRGLTVRRLTDCLIAAVAIRHDVAVLHADADFDALARCTPVRTA
jgi:predicted nucleic acid-binding protein